MPHLPLQPGVPKSGKTSYTDRPPCSPLPAPPKEMPFPASQKAKEISASCLRAGGDEGEDETPANHFLNPSLP